MKVSHERLEGNQVELKVEVDVEQVNIALDKAYKKVVKQIKVPGFRVGHIPRRILEARFGVEVLYNDAVDIILPEAYSRAVEEAGIEPIDRPEITEVNIEAGQPCTFTALVTVKPEVKLGQYTGLEIEEEQVVIAEEAVNRELEMLQQRHAQLKVAERNVVEKGDFAIIDFAGYIDGEPFEGGSGQEYSLEIGSNTFIEGFEDQLIGVEVGREVEVNVTFPEDYRAENLAGKPSTFKVTVKEIKVKDVPELNDDFAKDASDFETLEELKADIRNKLEENAQERAKRDFENTIVDTVAANAEIDVPAKMIDDELDNMFQNMSYSLQQQGIPFEKYLEYIGSSVEQWRGENRGEAEKRTRATLTLEAVAEKEGIAVAHEEIDNRIAEMAERNKQDVEQLKKFLLLQGQLAQLEYGMKMEKVIDFLIEKNKK